MDSILSVDYGKLGYVIERMSGQNVPPVTPVADDDVYETFSYLVMVSMIARKHGFPDKKGSRSTINAINDYLDAHSKGCALGTPSKKDAALAKAVLDWVCNSTFSRDPYLKGIASVLTGGVVDAHAAGDAACSAMKAYLHLHFGFKDAAQSKFIGIAGNKVELSCRVCRVIVTHCDSGYFTTYWLRDDQNNAFKWVRPGKDHPTLGFGRIQIQGTIRGTTARNGVVQTVLTRCKEISDPAIIPHIFRLSLPC